MLTSTSTASPEAVRQRRYRHRQCEAVFLAQVELRPADIEALSRLRGGSKR